MSELTKVISVSILTAGVFLIYILLIGYPKTQARNLYNHGVIQESVRDTSAAKQEYEAAYRMWPEQYILEKLESLK